MPRRDLRAVNFDLAFRSAPRKDAIVLKLKRGISQSDLKECRGFRVADEQIRNPRRLPVERSA
jgi:hypothetical protein